MPDAGETTGEPTPENDVAATETESTEVAPTGGESAVRTGSAAVWSDEIDDVDEDEEDDSETDDAPAPETTTTALAPEPEPVHELDAVLAGSEDRAREALADITPADTIGELVATIAQGEHVVSLQFANLMRGYPGWLWTATLSRIDESEAVNVLEVELLPGEGAVLAPDWVPWSVRLADYRAAQDASGERDETEDDEYEDDTVVDDTAEVDEDEILDDDDEADDDDVSDEDDSDDDDSDDDDDDDDDSDEDDEESDDDSDDAPRGGSAQGGSGDGRRGGSGRGRRRRRR